MPAHDSALPPVMDEEGKGENSRSGDDTGEENEGSSDDGLLAVGRGGSAVERPRRWLVLPEVATLLYFLALVTQFPVQQFWLYDHFAKELHLVEDEGDSNATHVCLNRSSVPTNGSSNSSDVENEVQSRTNRYVMYTNFISNFVAIFPTLFVGPLTDRYGRKFVFYISFAGLFLSLLLNTLVYRYDLNPALVCVSSLIQGLSGSYGLFLVACFAMVADISSPGKQRTIRVATTEATLAVATSVSTMTAGVWVKGLGYVWPMVVAMAQVVLAALFVLFFIPETLAERHQRSFSCKSLLKSFEFFVKDTASKRRFKLIAYLVSFLTVFWGMIGESNISILFLLHAPFCWRKEQITLFGGVLALLKWMAVVALLLLARRCVSLPALAIIGSLSAVAGYLLKGLATNSTMIFIAAAASLMVDLVGPMCRTLMSKSVEQNEQGALFAGIGVLQMVVSAVSGVVMSSVYSVGLDVYLGLPYLVLAGLVAVNVFLLTASIIYGRRHTVTEVPVDVDERLIT